MTHRLLAALAAAALVLSAPLCAAQTIYPIDNADILAGSRFDLKVEFPASAENQLKLTINGQDASTITGVEAQLVRNEDDGPLSALWLRGATIKEPGTYDVLAETASGSTKVTWNVYATGERKARNVILFIGDGMSVAHRTAARILSKGIKQGKYAGELAIDDMPAMALVSTSGSDSVITDSANSMSAYTTGHKTCVNAMGVYCASNANPSAHPKVENITSLTQRLAGMAVGIVTTSELTDATPAAMVAHTRKRSDMQNIARMMYYAAPDVLLGGGSAQFLPKSAGGVREDGVNYVEQMKSNGYAFASDATQMRTAAQDIKTTKLAGMFNAKDIDGVLDRKFLKKGTVPDYPDQPDLADETEAAIDVLARSPNGFVLMVESARIDKYSHNLDWERAVYETIQLDNAVQAAKDFARGRDDTMIVVVADHAHPVSIVGTFDDAKPGSTPRTKLSVYAEAGYPNYPAPDAQGYPPTADVSRRLAVLFGAYPDHCFAGRPNVESELVPTQPAADGNTGRVANEQGCRPGTVRLFGNLPFDQPQGVHAADDVVLTAMGPGSDVFHGHIDNTFVFRAIVNALGLAPQTTAPGAPRN